MGERFWVGAVLSVICMVGILATIAFPPINLKLVAVLAGIYVVGFVCIVRGGLIMERRNQQRMRLFVNKILTTKGGAR